MCLSLCLSLQVKFTYQGHSLKTKWLKTLISHMVCIFVFYCRSHERTQGQSKGQCQDNLISGHFKVKLEKKYFLSNLVIFCDLWSFDRKTFLNIIGLVYAIYFWLIHQIEKVLLFGYKGDRRSMRGILPLICNYRRSMWRTDDILRWSLRG